MMRRISIYLSALFAVLLFGGCAVHEWPDIKPDELPDVIPESPNTMILRLHYEPDMWVWNHTYDPMQGIVLEDHPEWGVDDDHPGTSERYANVREYGVMRIIVRAFRPNDTDLCLHEYTFTRDISEGYDCEVTLDIPDGEYVFYVWSDLCESESDIFGFDVSDFSRVSLLYDGDYYAVTDYRDGYRGSCPVLLDTSDRDVEDEDDLEIFDVTMRRPMAKYEFITTDLSEFLAQEGLRRKLTRVSIEDYKIEVVYSAYMPSSYNAFEDRLENSSTGMRYTSTVKITGESEASVGFDYVMIHNTPNASVQAEISVYDMSDYCVARSRQINVPLRRDHHTVLRGAFLTKLASGGVGVDPGFDGDHNIEIN